MTTLMPRDADGVKIPVLGLPTDSGAHQIALSGTSARNSTAFATTTRVITLYSTIDIFVNLGGGTVTASNTRHFIPAQTLVDLDIGGGVESQSRYLAALSADGVSTGTAYVSERL